MYFASDNAGPAHPTVMDAMVAANTGYQMGYGADTLMDGVRAQIREAFEAPDAINRGRRSFAPPWRISTKTSATRQSSIPAQS